MVDTVNHVAETLIKDVQFNCDISDARYARDATMCVYLLRMREFYRWRKDIALGIRLSFDDVGDWLTGVEEYWDDIEHEAYRSITIGGETIDPFDVDSVHVALQSENIPLVYSAGVGRRGKPHFFLAEPLAEFSKSDATGHQPLESVEVQVSGRELARDIVSQPAMSRGQRIWVRDDSVRRFLWETFEDWSFRSNDGPMSRIASSYGLQHDEKLDERLGELAIDVRDVLIAHERGEVLANAHLPTRWDEMMTACIGTTNEHYARAVRDSLSDSLSTWPMIAERAQARLLDFWLCGLNGAREQLFKASPAATVLSAANDADRLQIVSSSADMGVAYWSELAAKFVDQFKQDGAASDFSGVAERFRCAA